MASTFTDVVQAKLFARITAVPHEVANPARVTATLVPGSATLGTSPTVRVVAFSSDFVFVEWTNFANGAECYVNLELSQNTVIIGEDATFVADHGFDTAGVLAAITAMQASGSSTLVFTAGTYTFDMSGLSSGLDSALITIPAGTTVLGAGRDAQLVMTGIAGTAGLEDKGVFLIGGDNVTFDNLYMVGENGDSDGTGFVAANQNQSAWIISGSEGPTDVLVTRCQFHNLFGFSMHTQGAAYRWNFDRCYFRYCANGANINSAGSQQTHNVCFNSEGFECGADSIAVVDNVFQNSLGTAIALGGDTVIDAIRKPGRVCGNIIDTVANGPGGGRGIVVTSAQVGSIVSGNTIIDTYGYGIMLNIHTAGNFHVRDIKVEDNVLISCGTVASGEQGGIVLDDEGGHLVSGNTIIDEGHVGYAMATGIFSQGSSVTRPNIIVGNLIKSTQNDIVIGTGSSPIIHGNALLGPTRIAIVGAGTVRPFELITEPSGVALKVWDTTDTASNPPRVSVTSSPAGLLFGDGNGGAQDVNLYRPGGVSAGANLLKTDDKFLATSGLGIGNISATSYLGVITGKAPIYSPSDGTTILGYWPITDGTNVAVGDATYATLASTANGNGASRIGVEDSGNNFSATTVEGVLAELAGSSGVTLGTTTQIPDGDFSAGFSDITTEATGAGHEAADFLKTLGTMDVTYTVADDGLVTVSGWFAVNNAANIVSDELFAAAAAALPAPTKMIFIPVSGFNNAFSFKTQFLQFRPDMSAKLQVGSAAIATGDVYCLSFTYKAA